MDNNFEGLEFIAPDPKPREKRVMLKVIEGGSRLIMIPCQKKPDEWCFGCEDNSCMVTALSVPEAVEKVFNPGQIIDVKVSEPLLAFLWAVKAITTVEVEE